VFVNSVILDSPADSAQLGRGDIITSFAGVPLARADLLSQVLATLEPGQPVPVTYWRGGKFENTTVTPKVGRPLGK
jgi:S1-C subfamily serine protease